MEKEICSFCGREKSDTNLIISGISGYICNRCVEQAYNILEEENAIEVTQPKLINEIDITSLGVKPRFAKMKFIQKSNHCFYLCPFSEPFNTIYTDHIVKSLNKSGFSVSRADEIFGTQPIIEDIWEEINSSTIIIADVTNKNPNVMYEIGLAHTVGKPVVIISQSIDDVPFDLKHYRCILYEYTPRGCVDLEEKMFNTLRFLKPKN